MKKLYIAGILSVLVIALSIFYSYYSLTPHKISGKDTPDIKFSTARALDHIKIIAKEPHFVGTQYHKEVREYLIKELNKLGLKTEVQSQFSLSEKWGGATMNHNILARIKGTGNGKSVMVLSHYDSAPFASKGASDDAVGVATILEGLRAFIKSGTKHQNDIIILFSDGEEIGLNGAKAFVEYHPWAKDVGIVINFEARGSGGPSFALMETNGGNEMMVKSFSNAANPFPVANSFLYSVYKMLPNDTDLTMFRELGDIEGFNFAFIDDFYDYHCSTDNFENIDINTIEHQGSYFMSMLDQFKNYDLEKIKSEKDFVYFNFPGFNMIYYPFDWAYPLFTIAIIGFIVLLITGIFHKKISIKKTLKAFLIIVILFVGAIAFSHYFWKLIEFIHPSYSDILHGFPYNGHDYIAAFSFAIAGIILLFSVRLYRNYSIAELLFPVTLIWILLSGIFTFMLTGASFFIIPAFFLLIVLYLEMYSKVSIVTKVLIFSALSIPGLLIISPFIDMFPVGLRMKALPVSAFLVVLLILSQLPVLRLSIINKYSGIILIFSGIIFLVKAESQSGYNQQRPKPNSINYVYYADNNQAYWESINKIIDPWLVSIMGKNIKSGSYIKNDIASNIDDNVKHVSVAPLIDIALPVIKKTTDTVFGNERIIEFEIDPQRNSCYLELKTSKEINFQSFEVNGIRYGDKDLKFSKSKNSIISYYITNRDEKPQFKFTIGKSEKPELILYEASYDLIENPRAKGKTKTL